MKQLDFRGNLELQGMILGWMQEGDVVYCGTHETYPEVTEQFISFIASAVVSDECAVKPMYYHHVDIPGDGEPGIWVANGTDADREGEIVAAFEAWYIDEFSDDISILQEGDVEASGIYGLSMHHDIENNVYFVTIYGDSPMDID